VTGRSGGVFPSAAHDAGFLLHASRGWFFSPAPKAGVHVPWLLHLLLTLSDLLPSRSRTAVVKTFVHKMAPLPTGSFDSVHCETRRVRTCSVVCGTGTGCCTNVLH